MNRPVKNFARLCMILFGTLIFGLEPSAGLCAAERAVAVTALTEGQVRVLDGAKWQPVGEKQLMRNGSILETHAKGRVLLKFRDGSWMRIFQKTRISLASEKAPEHPRGRFERKWILNRGSFSAGLVPGRQSLEIRTPNRFEIQALEGVLSLSLQEGGTTVSVSRGTVKVRNARTGISLNGGQRLDRVLPSDLLSEKVHLIPFILLMEIQPKGSKDSGNLPQTLEVTVQLVRHMQNREMRRSGPLLLISPSSFYPEPRKLMLNSRGAAQIDLPLLPSLGKDPGSDGRVSLMVIMDSREAVSTVAGFAEYYVLPSRN